MRKRPLCLICICLMVAVWICKTCGLPIFGEPQMDPASFTRLQNGCYTQAEGTVTDRQQKSNSILYILSNVTATIDGKTIHFEKIKITDAESDSAQISLGSRVVFYGTLSRISHAENPGQFDAADYYASERIYYEMYAEQIRIQSRAASLREKMAELRECLAANQAKVMHADQAGVLGSMMLGRRTSLSAESRLNFQYGGIMHILAVSSLHITLLGMTIYRIVLWLAVRIFRKGRPAIHLAVTAAVLLTGIYCAFVGSPVSAVRAFLMFTVLLMSRICLRSYDSLSALGFAGILLLCLHPEALFSSGFQMSFSAVLGAAVLYPALCTRVLQSKSPNRHRDRQYVRYIRKLQEGFLLWISIMLATLPLTAWYYYEIPLLGGLLNLLAVPLIGSLMAVGAAGSLCTLFSLRIGWFLLIPVDIFLQMLEHVGTGIRRIPFSMWIVGRPAIWQIAVYYILLLLFVASVKKHSVEKTGDRDRKAAGGQQKIAPRILPVAAVILLLLRTAAPCSLIMLDVGQGDGLVIRTGVHTAYLVDCGSTDEKQIGTYRLIPYLKYCGIRRIKGIFLTHDDYDHYSGLLELLQAKKEKQISIRIDQIFLPDWIAYTEKGQQILAGAEEAEIPVRFLRAGDRITDGETQLHVLYPDAEETEIQPTDAEAGNDGSLVLHLQFRNFAALLTGDISSTVEEELGSRLPQVNCLKVAHHGSASATSARFLQITQPEIALISAPEDSVYGHPSEAVLERLAESGSQIYVTRDCGAIRVSTDGETMQVRVTHVSNS